jgi:prophage maintenance system killer protein
MTNNKIELFKSKDGEVKFDVSIEKDTVWLTQAQMAELFDKGRVTITEHIGNVFNEGELVEKSVCRDFRHTAKDGKSYNTKQYNLDVIISVGYRVKSKRGTQFRVWATSVLKDHLIKGYSQNDKRLSDIGQTISLVKSVLDSTDLDSEEATGLLRVVSDYSEALDLLDQYDHQSLIVKTGKPKEVFEISYNEARKAIDGLGEELSKKEGDLGLFGNEKDESFKSAIGTIYQTFGGKDLYPSLEEKAVNLLYFIIKNHAFSDGNKRIGAFIFIWFLERNNYLYLADGQKRIEDNTLVAICLMVAQSKPDDRDMMIKVVSNLLNMD